jgi:hypothetical protein
MKVNVGDVSVEDVWKHRTILDSVQYNNANSRAVAPPIERQENGVTFSLQPHQEKPRIQKAPLPAISSELIRIYKRAKILLLGAILVYCQDPNDQETP